MSVRRLRSRWCVVIGFLILGHPTVFGQTTTGTILGKVTDQTAGILPGVTVTVVNDDTNAQRVMVTDSNGGYEAPLLPPGNYRVEASLSGFKKVVRAGIHLLVNQRARIDLSLAIGNINEQVVVTADAPLVQAETGAVGTVIDNKKILELPLNGRDFFQLSTLVTGAAPPAEGTQNSTQGGAVTLNGVREQSNNFLLDGMDNNDLAINQIVIPPSADAVQEFKVQSNTYSAEFGRSAGAQFNYVTKSGTNVFHGSGYEFLRNAKLDAKNYFDPQDRPIPQFDRNQYGGTIGGPIRHDKLFFFANYEGTRVHQAFTRLATVPPTAWINGDFSGLLTGIVDPKTGLDTGQLTDPRTGKPIPGNIIPAARKDPAGAAILGFYPLPDDPHASGPTTATVSPIGRNNIDQMTVHIDQPMGSNQLSYRYSLWNENRFNAYDPLADPTNVPGFGSFTLNKGQSLVVGLTTSFGAHMLNDFRFGYNRLHGGIFQEHRFDNIAGRLGIQGLPTNPNDFGRPGVTLGITDALIEPTNTPQDREDSTFQLIDSLSWIHGGHTFKAGVDVRRFRLLLYLDVEARGNFIFTGVSGNPVADLLLGVPSVAIRQDPTTNTNMDVRTTNLGSYIQDDWKVSDNLTLNLGLRYDYYQPAYEAQNRFTVPDFSSTTGRFIQVGTEGVPRAGYAPDRTDFAPRVGFAWKPNRSERTAIRGGYGVFYDVAILNQNIGLRLNPPYFALGLVANPPSLSDAFSGTAAPITLVNSIDPNLRDGYYQQWSLGIQRELAPNLVLDLGYVGSKGTRLAGVLDPNQGPPGGPPVRNPSFGPDTGSYNWASSNYQSIQVRIERRFSRGLSVLSAYTWSRSRDDLSETYGSHASPAAAPQDTSNPLGDWGPSDFDSPHRWVVSTVWELPFGPGKPHLNEGGWASAVFGNWELAGIGTLMSARPFTVYYGGAANYSGTDNGSNGGPAFDRPNQTGNPVVANPTPTQWFNPAAFAPPNNTFGNVGRNTLRGDSYKNLDLALYKNVPLGNRNRVQMRFEAFNVFNRPYFFLPVADLTNSNAGRVVHAHDSRQIQLGLRFDF